MEDATPLCNRTGPAPLEFDRTLARIPLLTFGAQKEGTKENVDCESYGKAYPTSRNPTQNTRQSTTASTTMTKC
jgi:hypothetical protein